MPIRKSYTARRTSPVKARVAAKPRAAQGSPKAGSADAVTAGFYRDLVWNLRNGVLAVTRDGRIAVMNEVAYRILALPPRTTDIGRPFTQVLKDQPDVSRIVAGAFELSHLPEPGRAAAEEHGKGHRLHAVAGARPPRPHHRRDALLQGSDARRAARGAGAAARPAGGARRDGGRDCARGQEPAGGDRGDGRRPEAAAAGVGGRAVDPRATSSRKPRWPTPSCSRSSTSSVRSGCRSSASRSPTSCATRSRWRKATSPAARCRSRSCSRRTWRRSRGIRTSCGSCSRTC